MVASSTQKFSWPGQCQNRPYLGSPALKLLMCTLLVLTSRQYSGGHDSELQAFHPETSHHHLRFCQIALGFQDQIVINYLYKCIINFKILFLVCQVIESVNKLFRRYFDICLLHFQRHYGVFTINFCKLL